MTSNKNKLEISTFLIILTFFSFAFLSIMLPFFTPILWAVILAVLFNPMQRYFEKRLNGRSNLAAVITMFFCILIVVIPVMFVINSLFQESRTLLDRIRAGDFNLGLYLQHIINALPAPVHGLLEKMNFNFDINSIKDQLSTVGVKVLNYGSNQVINIGQLTLQFAIYLCVMLYLLFFILRDGVWLGSQIKRAFPLTEAHKTNLFQRFSTVIRATVKGSIIVACIQGALGGLAFWFLGIQGAILWGCIMSVLSLVPAVGSSLVWAPVAIYFLVTGFFWQGIILILYGVLVIGMVDTLLRPILVGKDTKLPDWLIMLSTLGGISAFGLNGFVLGPLLAAMFVTVWGTFTDKRIEYAALGIYSGEDKKPPFKKRRYYNRKKPQSTTKTNTTQSDVSND